MPLSLYKFGEYELDHARFELRCNGHPLKLERIPMELLLLLAEKDGNLVTRQEIVERLWGKDVHVDTEHGINTAVRKVRAVLGEDAEKPRYVQTVSGKGYRFVGVARNGNGGAAAATSLENTRVEAAVLEAPTSVATPSGLPRASVRKLSRLGIVAAVALVAGSGVFFYLRVGSRLFSKPTIGPIHSIAVLPLANLSGDASQDYFADGMTDELITALAQDRSLRVVSRTSAMQYKGVNRPVGEMARELGVDGILEGSVKRSTDRVHANLQLIYAPADAHLWAQSYDRALSEAAQLPAEMAQAVFKEIKSESTPPQPRAVNSEAHDAFLQGRYAWFSTNNLQAAEYFRKAIALQPDYAAAWAGLAIAYEGAAMTGELTPAAGGGVEQAAAVAKALELDPQSPDAHHALTAEYFFLRWDFARAEQESARTIQLDPNFAEAHHLRSYVLNALNRTSEALEEQRKATELDPFARPWALPSELWRLRRFDEALEDGKRRLAARPDDVGIHYLLSDCFGSMGDMKAAAEEKEAVLRLRGDRVGADAVKRAFQAGGGRAVEELDLMALNRRQAAAQYVQPIRFAYVYGWLGMKDEAIHFLELAYQEHSPRLVHLQYEPEFDFLHRDERYRAIVRKIGLPPAY